MRKPSRVPVKRSPRKAQAAKTPARRAAAAKKAAPPEISRDEALRLESIARKYEESERAWQRMTASPEGEEPWSAVEEHLVAHGRPADPERRWKYFSK